MLGRIKDYIHPGANATVHGNTVVLDAATDLSQSKQRDLPNENAKLRNCKELRSWAPICP